MKIRYHENFSTILCNLQEKGLLKKVKRAVSLGCGDFLECLTLLQLKANGKIEEIVGVDIIEKDKALRSLENIVRVTDEFMGELKEYFQKAIKQLNEEFRNIQYVQMDARKYVKVNPLSDTLVIIRHPNVGKDEEVWKEVLKTLITEKKPPVIVMTFYEKFEKDEVLSWIESSEYKIEEMRSENKYSLLPVPDNYIVILHKN